MPDDDEPITDVKKATAIRLKCRCVVGIPGSQRFCGGRRGGRMTVCSACEDERKRVAHVT